MADLIAYIPYVKPKGLSKGYKTNLAKLHKFAMAQHGFLGQGSRKIGCYSRKDFRAHYGIGAYHYDELRKYLRNIGDITAMERDVKKGRYDAIIAYWRHSYNCAMKANRHERADEYADKIEHYEALA